MPPRYVYWTIIYGNQATSFRAATPEELLPTLKQLQSRHPDAVLKYFARGQLWNSAEEARPRWRDDDRRRDSQPPAGERERRPRAEHGKPEGERRGKSWRPGGQHRDPRDRWKVPRDVKRKRVAARLRRDRVSPRPPRTPRPPKKKDDE
jgi:hypothetical protein